MPSEHHLEIKAGCREIVRGRSLNTFVTFTQPLEHKNGHVFLLLEATPECQQAPHVITLLRESVERLGRTVGEQGHLQHRFEQLLQAVNESLKKIIDPATCPLESMHMALGILRHDAFILSATGSIHLLFLRRTQKQRFRVFDLSHSIRSESGRPDPEKPFRVVLDGDLQPDDVLFVASKDLNQTLDVERIHPLLTNLPPASALETIEQYAPQTAALSVMLFQARKEKAMVVGFGDHASSKISMESLLHREQDTNAVLDLEKPHLQQWAMQLVHLLRTKDPLERKETLRRGARGAWHGIKFVGVRLVQLLGTLLVSLGSLASALLSRGSKREQALKSLKHGWRSKNRFLFMGGIALVIVIVVAAAGLSVQRKNTRANEAFAAQMQTAQDERDAATASQIYQDEPAARRHIEQAMAALDASLPRTEEQIKERDELKSALEVALRDLRHITEPTVTSTAIVNNVATHQSEKLLVLQDGSLAVFDGQTLAPRTLDASLPPTRAMTRHTSSYLFLGEDGLLRELKDGATIVQTVDINAVDQELSQATSIFHYGDRLYVQTPTQLYRHQRVVNGGYGPGVAWLSNATDLSNASALTIDGAVWIGGDGRVQRFDRGVEAGADTRSIDPALGTVRALWTVAETPLLFILDPENSRVVVYQKNDQKMLTQYVHPSFADALDLTVDLAAKSAIVVSPTSVHTFSLTSILP